MRGKGRVEEFHTANTKWPQHFLLNPPGIATQFKKMITNLFNLGVSFTILS